MPADPDPFRAALTRFPSGVTVVTTRDQDGTPWGFTASSFCSLSAEPPQVLVCLANDADCYAAFRDGEAFAVNVLAADQEDVARLFATKGADKFGQGAFRQGTRGLPVLDGAVAVLECRVADRLPGGDHTILVGDVQEATAREGDPAIYCDRTFRELRDLEAAERR